MTITPTDPSATAPAAIDPAGTGAPAAAGDFLAAILQAMAPTTGPTAPAAPGVADPGADETRAEDASADMTTPGVPAAVPPADAAALGLVLPPGLADQLAAAIPKPAGTAAASPADPGRSPGTDAVAAAAPGHANVAGGTPVAPTGTGRDIRMSGDAVVRHSPAGPGAAVPTAPAPADPSGVDPVRATGPTTATAPDTSQPVGPAPQPVAPQPAVPQPVTPTPITTTDATDAGNTTVQHVTRQVFPEVTSLVTRGDGTHRITLTLAPEALGEVRVVMTVRDGSVHVRLAGGPEAQLALRDGSHELTRLLEVAGASDSRIVVRDLPAAAPSASANGFATDLGTGGQRPQDQHAGTRAHQPATDGTHDGTRHRRVADGATEPRTNEPVTRTRTAGVDVTM
jgi:flagellar hook-length control protein FliK